MEKIKKIQLAPVRIIPDVLTVWHEHGPQIDVVMDPKRPSFPPGSLDAIYSFHVLGGLFGDQITTTLTNWFNLLAPNGELFLIVDDFEFLARSLIGGDLTIEQFNERHTAPTHFTRDNLEKVLAIAGFVPDAMRIWYTDVGTLFKKQPYELVFSVKKI